MLGLSLTLVTAFLAATEAAFAKRFLGDLRALELAAYPLLYSLPLFGLVLAWIPAPPLDPGFWPTVAVLLPINAIGFCFQMSGIKHAPLSLTMPLLSFTPAFVLLIGFLLLGEVPNFWGLLGVFGVVSGSYILNLGEGRWSLLAPLKAIVRDRGCLHMFLAALIWSVAAVAGKKIILQSSPLYAISVFYLLHNSLFLAALILTGRVRPLFFLGRPREGSIVAATFFLHNLAHFYAVILMPVAYMIAIKRLSGLFSVLYGGIMFKEKNIRYRLAGTVFMCAGAAVIAILG